MLEYRLSILSPRIPILVVIHQVVIDNCGIPFSVKILSVSGGKLYCYVTEYCKCSSDLGRISVDLKLHYRMILFEIYEITMKKLYSH